MNVGNRSGYSLYLLYACFRCVTMHDKAVQLQDLLSKVSDNLHVVM